MANQTKYRYLILLCLLATTVEFSLRGPVRTIQQGEFTDFTGMYVASREWVGGTDPYLPNQFMQTWVTAGGEPFFNRGSDANLRPAYPPSTLPVLAPFAFFGWFTARDLFLLSSVTLFPFMLWAALRLAAVHWSSNAGLVFCAFALALAPWHAGIAWQSISAQTLELAIIGASLRSDIGGGLLTGLAVCLKPQLAGAFLLFELVRWQWKRIGTALIPFACSTAIALLRMPAGWQHSYLQNLSYFFAIGDVNDFTLRNPTRFELLNLQVIFYFLTRIYGVANILSWIVTAGLLFSWWRRKYPSISVQLATVVLICLLPVYQRIYNAGAVVLFLPFAISQWKDKKFKILIALSSVFLIPGSAILETCHQKRWISDRVWNQSWWFNLFVGCHATWALLAIIGILLFWVGTNKRVRNPTIEGI